MSFVSEYRATKAAFDSMQGQAQMRVRRVWEEYVRQKIKVSVNRHGLRWGLFAVRSFKIGESRLKVVTRAYGQYDYSEEKVMSFPAGWLELDEKELQEAVAGRIKAEGEDIARREAAALVKAEQAKQAKIERLRTELENLEKET